MNRNSCDPSRILSSSSCNFLEHKGGRHVGMMSLNQVSSRRAAKSTSFFVGTRVPRENKSRTSVSTVSKRFIRLACSSRGCSRPRCCLRRAGGLPPSPPHVSLSRAPPSLLSEPLPLAAATPGLSAKSFGRSYVKRRTWKPSGWAWRSRASRSRRARSLCSREADWMSYKRSTRRSPAF